MRPMKTAKVKSEFTFTMAFKSLMWTLVVEEEDEDEEKLPTPISVPSHYKKSNVEERKISI